MEKNTIHRINIKYTTKQTKKTNVEWKTRWSHAATPTIIIDDDDDNDDDGETETIHKHFFSSLRYLSTFISLFLFIHFLVSFLFALYYFRTVIHLLWFLYFWAHRKTNQAAYQQYTNKVVLMRIEME